MAEATTEQSTRSRVITYLEEVRSELRKVVWPKREESINLTVVVLVVMALVMVIISGFDSILNVIFERLLDWAGQ